MNVSEALIREIVTKVLEESAGKGSKPEFEKHIDPSGIITSRPPTGPATPTLSTLPTGSKGMAVSGRPSFARTSGQRREMA